MAHIYRGAASDRTTSPAELDLLKRFERLPDSYTIIHSVPWQGHPDKEVATTEGEIDFLIAHPEYGLLVLEVKGGVISTRREQMAGKWETVWYTKPIYGAEAKIHDPFQQAERNRRNLIVWLEKDGRTKRFSWKDLIYHAVMLPDSQVTNDLRPDCPEEISIDISGADALEKRIGEIFKYWKTKYPVKFSGRAAVDAVVDLLLPKADLTPSLAAAFQAEGKQIERLTEEQFDILKNLRFQTKAAIVGGAGTGKTVLAMEKTRRLVDQDKKRVLFLCFNRNLAKWIGEKLNDEKEALLEVLTFHQLVERYLRRAGIDKSKLSNEDFLNKAGDLLQDAVDQIKRKSAAQMDLYDAIIVDEAQDFQDEWWIPLPDLLKDSDNGIMYLFFDDNQRIYRQLNNIPFKSQAFSLVKNCRNTRGIFNALKPYLPANDETVCIGPEGRSIEIVPAPASQDAYPILDTVLNRLLKEGVLPTDIVLLTPVRRERSIWDGYKSNKYMLAWDFEVAEIMAKTAEANPLHFNKMVIRACTLHSFKGLESPVVILSEMDKAYTDTIDQLAYVALSRARNHVVVLGVLPQPKKAQI